MQRPRGRWANAFACAFSLALSMTGASACELAVSLDHYDDGCRPTRGPSAVRIQGSGVGFCIDTTEVTNGQYQDFLTAMSAPGSKPPAPQPGCEQQVDFTPSNHWPAPPGDETFPVVYVDWCQAYAYCAWAGKRICGRIGGGPLAAGPSEFDATQSEWLYACSRGGARTYPYGSDFDAAACGGKTADSPIGPVGAHAQCVGGYDGIHDMSGNVWEWSNACDSSRADSQCHALGGAFDSTDSELACKGGARSWTRFSGGAGNIGIRCCQDL